MEFYEDYYIAPLNCAFLATKEIYCKKKLTYLYSSVEINLDLELLSVALSDILSLLQDSDVLIF